MQARLALVSPAAAAKEFKLNLPTTIGRSRDAKLKLVHTQVSRLHCEIFDRGGMLYVRDLGSTNGTFVNDERVTNELPLPPGASLMLGTVALRALYGQYNDEILPPGMMAASETVRAAPQEETFRVTDPNQLSEAELAESPFGFAEFESFTDDAGADASHAGAESASAGPESASADASPFDWLGESDTAPAPAAKASLPKASSPKGSSPKSPPPGVTSPNATPSTPASPPSPAASLPADFDLSSAGEASEAELEELDFLESAADGASVAQPPSDHFTPSELEPAAEFVAGEFDSPSADAEEEVELLPLEELEPGDLEAGEKAADEPDFAAMQDHEESQKAINNDAPNYFESEQADPTPLDDKRWRVPDDMSAPFADAAPKAASTQRSKVAPQQPSPAAVKNPAPTPPAPSPPAKSPVSSKSPAPVEDDLENFFNSFQ